MPFWVQEILVPCNNESNERLSCPLSLREGRTRECGYSQLEDMPGDQAFPIATPTKRVTAIQVEDMLENSSEQETRPNSSAEDSLSQPTLELEAFAGRPADTPAGGIADAPAESPAGEHGGRNAALPAVGNTFTINGITFKITSLGESYTASVAGPRSYSGRLIVPATVRPDSAGPEYKVTTIPDNAFSNGFNLTSLDLTRASNLVDIGTKAFKGCINLAGRLVIPSSVKSIGLYAFSDCSSLSSLDLSGASSLVTIGSMAFYNCYGLTGELVFPESVATIGSDAFVFCRKLASLDLSGASSLTTIGARAFSDCTKLSGGLTIPASVEAIEGYAFVDTQFDSLTFCGTPAIIGTNLFSLGETPNTSLVRITFRQGDVQEGWDTNAFDGVPPSGTLVYKEGAVRFGASEFCVPHLEEWTHGTIPAISSVASATLACGETFTPRVLSGTDVSWSASGLPEGVGFDTATGTLSVADSAAAGGYALILRATNTWGYDEQDFTLVVPASAAVVAEAPVSTVAGTSTPADAPAPAPVSATAPMPALADDSQTDYTFAPGGTVVSRIDFASGAASASAASANAASQRDADAAVPDSTAPQSVDDAAIPEGVFAQGDDDAVATLGVPASVTVSQGDAVVAADPVAAAASDIAPSAGTADSIAASAQADAVSNQTGSGSARLDPTFQLDPASRLRPVPVPIAIGSESETDSPLSLSRPAADAEDSVRKVLLPFIALGLGALVLVGTSAINHFRRLGSGD